MLRYPCKISDLDLRWSSLSAMKNSFTLRLRVWSCERYVFFTNCWVMVEPPWASWPLAMFTAARAIPESETPESE